MREFVSEDGGFNKVPRLSESELAERVNTLLFELSLNNTIPEHLRVQSELLDLWNVHNSSDLVISALNEVKKRLTHLQKEIPSADILPAVETRVVSDQPVESADERADINRKFAEITKNFYN